METILVATDLSERSDRALERALALAAQHKATCHVVSVVEDAIPVDVTKKMEQDIAERLVGLVGDQAESAEITILRGEIVEMLNMFSSLHEADLLVLGVHQTRKVLDTMRETTMERVVTSSPLPVLLVRDAVEGPYKNALVPVSFSDSCAGAIKAVSKIAPDASISAFHALHVMMSGINGDAGEGELAQAAHQDAQAISAKWQKSHPLPEGMEQPDIVTGAVRGVMDAKMAELSTDLLAIGAHTRSGLSLYRLGKIAAELVRDPPVDLLVSPPPQS